MLCALAPEPDNYRVFLLSTGSEATENCIKLAKTYALEKYGAHRKYVNGMKARDNMGLIVSGIVILFVVSIYSTYLIAKR